MARDQVTLDIAQDLLSHSLFTRLILWSAEIGQITILLTFHSAWCGLNNYFKFYNEERLHGALDKRTPHEVYFQQH